MDATTKSVVYFIENERTGHIKIGFTTQAIELRLKNIVSENEGHPLRVLATMNGGHVEEAVLHRVFSPYRVGLTEWFTPHESLIDFIEREAVPYVRDTDDTADVKGECPFDCPFAKYKGEVREQAARTFVRVLGITEAADIMGLASNTIRTHVRKGNLPAQRVGREYAILEPDLVWFSELDRGPGRPPKARE